MILFFAKFLLMRNPAMTLQHARRLAKIGLAVAAAVLLVIALVVVVWMIRKDAVEDHQAGRTEDALEGERRANAGDAARREAREADSEQTNTELETIHAEDPEGAAAPASRGSRAVADRLRN